MHFPSIVNRFHKLISETCHGSAKAPGDVTKVLTKYKKYLHAILNKRITAEWYLRFKELIDHVLKNFI